MHARSIINRACRYAWVNISRHFIKWTISRDVGEKSHNCRYFSWVPFSKICRNGTCKNNAWLNIFHIYFSSFDEHLCFLLCYFLNNIAIPLMSSCRCQQEPHRITCSDNRLPGNHIIPGFATQSVSDGPEQCLFIISCPHATFMEYQRPNECALAFSLLRTLTLFRRRNCLNPEQYWDGNGNGAPHIFVRDCQF